MAKGEARAEDQAALEARRRVEQQREREKRARERAQLGGLWSRRDVFGRFGWSVFAAFSGVSLLAAWAFSLDRSFVAMIVDRYEADIAFSFVHSMRRNIGLGLWRPVAYSFPPPSKLRVLSMASV